MVHRLYMAMRLATRPVAERRTQPDRRISRRGGRLIVGLFCFIVCVLFADALVGDQGLLATMRARKQYNRLVADLDRLRGENRALRDQARRLREDPSAIEEIARRELGLMSPGEKLFIIKDVADTPRLSPPQR